MFGEKPAQARPLARTRRCLMCLSANERDRECHALCHGALAVFGARQSLKAWRQRNFSEGPAPRIMVRILVRSDSVGSWRHQVGRYDSGAWGDCALNLPKAAAIALSLDPSVVVIPKFQVDDAPSTDWGIGKNGVKPFPSLRKSILLARGGGALRTHLRRPSPESAAPVLHRQKIMLASRD